jgi:hypothetical protein
MESHSHHRSEAGIHLVSYRPVFAFVVAIGILVP